MSRSVKDHKIVPENEWVKSRKALLNRKKEFTILHDHLSQQRHDLPLIVVIKIISLSNRAGRIFVRSF